MSKYYCLNQKRDKYVLAPVDKCPCVACHLVKRIAELEKKYEALANREIDLMVFIDNLKPQMDGRTQRVAREILCDQVARREPKEKPIRDIDVAAMRGNDDE